MKLANVERAGTRAAPYILSMLRIVAALLFLSYGTAKFFGFPGPGPKLTPLLTVAGVFELVGGTLLVIGLFSRPVAFVLSGMMAVGYFVEHLPRGFFPTVNRGSEAIMFCFIFLYVAAAGPGPWSLDAWRGPAWRGPAWRKWLASLTGR